MGRLSSKTFLPTPNNYSGHTTVQNGENPSRKRPNMVIMGRASGIEGVTSLNRESKVLLVEVVAINSWCSSSLHKSHQLFAQNGSARQF
jgi:hypothetical protein